MTLLQNKRIIIGWRKNSVSDFQHFINMGGYGFYVWSAYGSALIFLAIQWFLPWRRWQRYLKQRAHNHE